MSENAAGDAAPAMRGYMVTVVGKATEDYRLSEPSEVLHLGVKVELSGGKVLLHVPVQASSAAIALSTGRAIAEDFFRVLGARHAPYPVDQLDEGDVITRTDAVYIGDGPVPEADVAEGRFSDEGVQWLDPDGEGRRAGKVFRVRARAEVVHPITADALRFGGRDRWSPRLGSGLSLYWAGQ